MELICYPLLSTRSRRSLTRKYGRFGNVKRYRPRAKLLERLAKELGWNIESVRQQIYRERAFFLELKK